MMLMAEMDVVVRVDLRPVPVLVLMDKVCPAQ